MEALRWRDSLGGEDTEWSPAAVRKRSDRHGKKCTNLTQPAVGKPCQGERSECEEDTAGRAHRPEVCRETRGT